MIALSLSLLAALTLAACGGGEEADLLPGETASEINANLDLVEDLVADGDCVGAANAAAAVTEQVEGLTGVDQELQQALSRGAERLNEVVVECDEAPEEEETVPTVDPEEEELEREDEEKEERAGEKAEKNAEKEQQREEKAEKETPQTEPPGQEKGKEKEEPEAQPVEPPSGGTPSGGVGPGAPAGGE